MYRLPLRKIYADSNSRLRFEGVESESESESELEAIGFGLVVYTSADSIANTISALARFSLEI